MMFSTEFFSDFRERRFGHLLGKIHGDLAGKGDFWRVVLGFQLGYLDFEFMADGFLDLFHRHDCHR